MLLPPVSGRTNSPPARLSVSGYGIFGNRQLKNILTVLQKPGARPRTFDANFVEDAVLVLFSRINRDGFLYPKIHATVRFEDGHEETFTWTNPLGEPLPRPFPARHVEFKIEPGVLFYFEKINFAGVEAIPLKDAAHFFIQTDVIIFRKQDRVYSPERLNSGMKSLQEALERKGYESASVATNNFLVNTNTGS
ncbi:MAG TPA: POTRA domain-containing protein, partial [Verrucomicrobiae bacterium]|nr:POTRA domain-containing protein [Verrucomicrobiae bacterium]